MEQLQLHVYQAGYSVQKIRNLGCHLFWEGTVYMSEMRSSSVALCERVTSHLSRPVGTKKLACASSLRAVGTEFTVHVFRDMTLPARGQALTLWWVGYAV